MFRSDDPQRDQNYQKHCHKTPLADQEIAAFLGLHVRNIVAGKEKGHISGNEYGDHAPPFVNPDEGMVVRRRQEGFKQSKEKGHLHCTHQLTTETSAAVFCEITFAAVLRQHFKGYYACKGKHHGKLPAYADEQDEGSGLI